MTRRMWTYLMLLVVLILRTAAAYAMISDPIVSALDTVNGKIESVGTIQDDYTAIAKGYMQEKMGSLGDVKQVQKQSKKLEQAKKSVERLQKEKKKLMKYVEKAKELKDKALEKVQEFQELKAEIEGEVKKFDEEYIGKIKEAKALAEQKYKEATEYYESLAAKAEEAKDTLKEYGIEEADETYDDESLDYMDGEEYETESARVTFGVAPQIKQTALPRISQTVQYIVPQGVTEEGTLSQMPIQSPVMTMLPIAAPAEDARVTYIGDRELTSEMPNISELPDASQMLQMPAEGILLEAHQAEVKGIGPVPQVVEQKSSLSLKDQLLAKDVAKPQLMENAETKISSPALADVLPVAATDKVQKNRRQERLLIKEKDKLLQPKEKEIVSPKGKAVRQKEMKSLRHSFRQEGAVKLGGIND